ncbi:hypothetical protein J7376_12110 [Paracoccus sp. R12_1]|uniref:hypothetical protein n=1 Tax=unclassified Paracoccus (in: a-proteobacteria) TaxID=2688777 RepID=UPI001ADCB2E7|nr:MULTISPECIES: hypothetical protein [unclassified Paracoccus (in: a-proteobacteria)]MBO9454638.1 hypothetical protein [Paracoccus sp. R12_2]MBO9487269.1 hypothetical protein [Paracoccus sp. R12_1]
MSYGYADPDIWLTRENPKRCVVEFFSKCSATGPAEQDPEPKCQEIIVVENYRKLVTMPKSGHWGRRG